MKIRTVVERELEIKAKSRKAALLVKPEDYFIRATQVGRRDTHEVESVTRKARM